MVPTCQSIFADCFMLVPQHIMHFECIQAFKKNLCPYSLLKCCSCGFSICYFLWHVKCNALKETKPSSTIAGCSYYPFGFCLFFCCQIHAKYNLYASCVLVSVVWMIIDIILMWLLCMSGYTMVLWLRKLHYTLLHHWKNLGKQKKKKTVSTS